MKYSVMTQSQAVADAENIRSDLESISVEYAERWINELEKAGRELAMFPNRFPQAPESRRSTRIIRHMFVGRYRVLFAVMGDAVHILRIRHASQRPFKPGELN